MLQRCLADISGPFYDLDKPFRNWSSLPFYQLDLPHAPYIDERQLALGVARACVQLTQLHAQGYTGIVIDNLAHLATFATAPVALYTADSAFAQRAARYGAAFAALFAAATQRRMDIFVSTDMQWSTPPIRAYVGPMTATNPRLAAVNRWALDELFRVFPQVSGIIVRTGEAGGAHNHGSDYAGHMVYTTVNDLRHLLDTLLPVCAQHDRLLVLRTWSLGIGETGDLLWSTERYQSVFRGFSTRHLLVSIKHGPSDFFRLLPHNPTIGLPGPRQIVELQNRREYELFGMIPSTVAALHGAVLQHALAQPNVVGVWAWNATGGWGGGRAALGVDGWNAWTRLSSALTAALARDPRCDTTAFVVQWCVATYGTQFGAAVAELYNASATLIEQGWYLGQLNHSLPTLGGVYLPSLLWVWWMRPTAAPLIWAYLAVVTDHAAVLRDGAAARKQLAHHVAHLVASAPADDPRAAEIVSSARYFHAALVVAQAIRSLLLPLYAAAHAGDRHRWLALSQRAAPIQAVLAQHRIVWGTNADFPALELDEIVPFLEQLATAPTAAWLKARAACLLVARVQGGRVPGRLTYATGVSVTVALAFLRRSPTLGALGVLSALLAVPSVRARAVRAALPWLNKRFNLVPTIFFEAGPALAEWVG